MSWFKACGQLPVRVPTRQVGCSYSTDGRPKADCGGKPRRMSQNRAAELDGPRVLTKVRVNRLIQLELSCLSSLQRTLRKVSGEPSLPYRNPKSHLHYTWSTHDGVFPHPGFHVLRDFLQLEGSIFDTVRVVASGLGCIWISLWVVRQGFAMRRSMCSLPGAQCSEGGRTTGP